MDEFFEITRQLKEVMLLMTEPQVNAVAAFVLWGFCHFHYRNQAIDHYSAGRYIRGLLLQIFAALFIMMAFVKMGKAFL